MHINEEDHAEICIGFKLGHAIQDTMVMNINIARMHELDPKFCWTTLKKIPVSSFSQRFGLEI